MKKLLTTLIILFLPLTLMAAGGKPSGARPNVVAGCTENCTGLDICEGGEGTGTPDGWTDLEGAGGDVDWDDTSSTVGYGSQQLKIASNTAESNTIHALTAADEYYGHIKFRVTDATPTAAVDFYFLMNSGGGGLYVTLRTDGNIRAWHGTSYTTTSTTPCNSDNAWYHMWTHYSKATDGNNGVYEVWVGSTGTFASATKIIEGTNGQSTAQVNQMKLRCGDVNNAFYFDQKYVKTTAIGDVCD